MHDAGMQKILLIQMARMGDILQTTALMKGLKQLYPDSTLTLIMDKSLVPSLSRFLPVDYVSGVDMEALYASGLRYKNNLKKRYRYFKNILSSLPAERFDLVININYSKITALFTELLNFNKINGYKLDSQKDITTTSIWLSYILCMAHARPVNRINLVDVFYRLMIKKGPPGKIIFNDKRKNRNKVETLIHRYGLKEKRLLIGFQLGSKHSSRRWPIRNYALLAEKLIRLKKGKIVLLGTNSEKNLKDRFIKELSMINHELVSSVLNLMGETTIFQLAGCLKQFSLLITGDTGTMHLAAAEDVPVLALFFGPAWAHETGPYGKGHRVIQVELDCSPCLEDNICRNPVCKKMITPELVFNAAEDMLDSFRRRGMEDKHHFKYPANGNIAVYNTDMDQWGAVLHPLTRREMTIRDISGVFYRELARCINENSMPPKAEIILNKLETQYHPPDRKTVVQLAGKKDQLLSPIFVLRNKLLQIKKTDYGKQRKQRKQIKDTEQILKTGEDIFIEISDQIIQTQTGLTGKVNSRLIR